MYYDRLLDKYKVLSRYGSEVFVTADEFDSANDNNNDYTDEERSIANQQPWTDRAAAKIASYELYCARNIIPKEVVTKPPLSSAPTIVAISTNTKTGSKVETGPTVPAGDAGSSSTSTTNAELKRGHRGDVTQGPDAVVAAGSKMRPLTNAFLPRAPNNANIQDDEDFFSSVTKLGTSGDVCRW